MRFASRLRPWVPVVLGGFLLTCGGGGSPTAPRTPGPSATPPPVTQPSPPPVQTLCQKLGYVPSADTRCSREAAGAFQTQVDGAIDRLIQQHPELFENASGGIRIRSIGAYYVGVIENLDDTGLCAGFDGEEVQVKESNDFNEQFDISSSSGYVRRGDSAYRSTCRPAAFPTPEPPPIPPPAGCSLPSSREIACGPQSPSFLGDVESAIDQVIKEHPEYFDLNQVKKGTSNWYKVVQINPYVDAVAAAMGPRGYCGRFDGEELVVKRTNTFSDHYDILTGDGFIRRGQGMYRVTCYPAAF